jgi:GTP cyclohydrolase IA
VGAKGPLAVKAPAIRAGRRAGPAVPPQGAPGKERGFAAAPDLAAGAVARFLDALGLPPAVRGAADLADTPRRVAEAWLEDLVDGYGREPAEILAESLPSEGRDLVAVTGIDFHSVCPHHLLPSRGVAHVGYVPGGKVVGFGQIVKLVDALAHRLVLEEDLARQIADALVLHLGARGAACLLEAEQLCMTVRGEKRARARAHAEAWAGTLARDGAARRRFQALAAAASGSGRGGKRRHLR